MQDSLNALVTYIYPAGMKYFPDFLQSVYNQNYKNFELVIFNDGVDENTIQIEGLNYRVIPMKGTPLEIRLKSIDYLKNSNFQKIVFADVDDTSTKNRLELVLEELGNYSLVCNDLNLMDKNGYVYANNIWKPRLSNKFVFDHNFLVEKNIVGFGNTGVRKELLKWSIQKVSIPIAADWFIFYQIIKSSSEKSIFITKCQSNYRQHENNDAGISVLDVKKIQHVINVKRNHYKALLQIGYTEMQKELNNIDEINLNSISLKENKSKAYPFWWEETSFINDIN